MSGDDELTAAYRSVGVSRGRVVYVASNMGRMRTSAAEDGAAVMAQHLDTLREIVGPEGVLVVPTACLDLCNTATVFDPVRTPSSGMGVFSEHVRQQPGAERSFHPFWSVAALGGGARALVADVPRHCFGADSIWERLVSADALSLHVGIHPRQSFSIIHHIELEAGVPYRYTKEFMHPVRRGDRIVTEPFYHFVTYRDADIERDGNVKIFDHFSNHAEVREAPFARGRITAFSMRAFYQITRRLLAHDLYGWLHREPTKRPYRV